VDSHNLKFNYLLVDVCITETSFVFIKNWCGKSNYQSILAFDSMEVCQNKDIL